MESFSVGGCEMRGSTVVLLSSSNYMRKQGSGRHRTGKTKHSILALALGVGHDPRVEEHRGLNPPGLALADDVRPAAHCGDMGVVKHDPLG